jgi:hypothetical protein
MKPGNFGLFLCKNFSFLTESLPMLNKFPPFVRKKIQGEKIIYFGCRIAQFTIKTNLKISK